MQLDSPDIALPRQKIAQGHVNVRARDSLLRYQLALKISDYTHIQEFTIFVGTWNVNGQAPTISLAEWLSCDAEPPDVYAIGFQELDLSKEAFLFNDTPREDEWQYVLFYVFTKILCLRFMALCLVGELLQAVYTQQLSTVKLRWFD